MQVSSFFIGEAEITNADYRSYVTWLKFVFLHLILVIKYLHWRIARYISLE